MTREAKFFLWISLICIFAIAYLYGGDANGSDYQSGILRSDKRIIEARDKKIISPSQVWTWWNSWHLVRRQAPFYGRKIPPPYTLTNSFVPRQAEELTWAHFSFAVWQKQIRELSDCNITKIEEWILEERKHSARVIRIDKIATNFYIVAYVRNKQNENIREVDGYRLFSISPQISDEAIFFNIPIKDIDPYKRRISLQPKKFLTKDIFLLNPSFFLQPTELEYIAIPYSFFAHKFIYEHHLIKKFAFKRGDPMIIKIKNDGIEVGFKKQMTIPES